MENDIDKQINVIVKILYSIKDVSKFYFKTYAKDIIKNLVKSTNEEHLTYQEYLFGELLAIHNNTYNDMEYDKRFKLLPFLYEDFTSTPYYKQNKSEYECIRDYLKAKDYVGTILEEK